MKASPPSKPAHRSKPAPKRILFVCYGNACRSQMAEALARHLANDVIEAASAGLSPMGRVPEATRQVLLEKEIDADGLFSKGLLEVTNFQAELIVNMSGLPGKSLFREAPFEDWKVEDPYGDDVATYRRICEDIEARVMELAGRIRAEIAAAPKKA